MDAKQICNRVDALMNERSNMEATYDLIEEYIRPFTGKYFNKVSGENAVDWRTRQLYDSTAPIACRQLAASIHGSLTPPLIQWLELVFRSQEMNEDQEAVEWLEECSRITYQALQESDIHLELNKAFLDLVSWGIAFVFEEEGDEPGSLDFSTPPMKESFFEEGADGQPFAFYRVVNRPYTWWVDKFGADCPDWIRGKYEAGDVESRAECVLAIWKRQGEEFENQDVSKTIEPGMRPWGYGWVDKKGKEFVGKEGGYYERPVFAPRWNESSDSRFGVSPGILALADVLTLNEVVKLTLSAAEKAIDPPYEATEAGLVSDIDLSAGGITLVNKQGSLSPLLQTSAFRFDVSNLQKDELRTSIRQAFYEDDLQLKESPAMTATEVNARMDLMQRVLGPTFGYLKTYLLDPLIQRTFNILLRSNRLPPVPESVKAGNAEMDIEYLGTLTRAVRQDRVMNLVGFLDDAARIGEMFPQALDKVDVDEIMQSIAEARNVGAKHLRSDIEVKNIRDERKAAAQQQTDVEQAGTLGGVVRDMEQARRQGGGINQ